jgi:hypothetical protein
MLTGFSAHHGFMCRGRCGALEKGCCKILVKNHQRDALVAIFWQRGSDVSHGPRFNVS